MKIDPMSRDPAADSGDEFTQPWKRTFPDPVPFTAAYLITIQVSALLPDRQLAVTGHITWQTYNAKWFKERSASASGHMYVQYVIL